MSARPILFRDSPFALTASRDTATCWAGRPAALSRLVRITRSLTSRPDSSLDLIWANLGAGKSHALHHLRYLCELQRPDESQKVISAQIEMPDRLDKFLELYRRIVNELPLPTVASCIVGHGPDRIPDDLIRCGRAVLHGGPTERELARQWFLGHRPGLRELKSATNIQSRIEDDSYACSILSGIIAASSHAGVRLLILLDEFQRVAFLQPKRKREAVLSNIRTLFSENPHRLSVVLAVKSRIEQTALELIPEELRTLMAVRPTISLPEFSESEALEFVLDRFKYFRPPTYIGDDSAPFTKDAIVEIIRQISARNGTALIPRTILQALAWIYDGSADPSGTISREESVKLFEELRWDAKGAD